jgi:hypothetical protein
MWEARARGIRKGLFVLPLVALLGAACSRDEGESDERAGSLQQALTQQTYSVRLPQGLSTADVIFGANGSLFLNDGVDLREANNSRARVANSGSVATNVGVQATPGSVYSVAGVTLRDRSHVFGFVKGQGAVSTQSQVVVDGGIQQNAPLNVRTAVTWDVTFPTPQRDVVLDPDRTTTLTPGGYGVLNLKSRSVATFSTPGVYYFKSFALEPQSKLDLKNASGPIYIFVEGGALTFRGVLQRQDTSKPNIFIGYGGTADAVIDAPFIGTLVAPNAKISLISTSAGHKGSFFGKSVDAANPWTRYDHQAFTPGDCNTNGTACSIGFGCADANNNGKADCGECPAGRDVTDSDGDGFANCIDACPADPAKVQPGVCGCNRSDADNDHDGFADDCQDACRNDPTNACLKTARPDFLPIPKWPGSTPDPKDGKVDPTKCIQAAALPEPPADGHANPPPSPSVLQQTLDAVPTSGGTCIPEVDVASCPLAPATVTETSCESQAPATKGQGDNALCASLGPNFRCGYAVPPSCAADPERPDCKGKSLRCGLPDPSCTNDIAPPDTSPSSCTGGNCPCATVGNPACSCAEIEVCPSADATGNAGPAVADAYTPTQKPTSTEIASHQNPAPPPVFQDDPNQPGCPRPISGNCWCRLGMDDPPNVSDGDAKHGDHGGGSLISLSFDPGAAFNVDLNPMPFGDSTFKADASANFLSQVAFTLPFIGRQSATILDAVAQVKAERCRLSMGDTHFKVFGVDFVDLLEDEPFDTASTAPGNATLKAAGEACSKAISTFDDLGDRTKKALRDAQTLLAAYKQLASNKTFDKTAFCLNVGNTDDPGFPSGNCLADTPETTINRYVTYYKNRIGDLLAANQALATSTASFVSALSQKHEGKINFLNFSRSESEEIFSVIFFVGPIPVNIAVDVMISYGVDGNLYYSYAPPSGLALAPGTKTQLVGISGGVEPRASAGIALFAGVGFGVPGFSVRAGIRGQLTLAAVSALLKSGVGLTMEAQADDRPIPPDLLSVSSGELLLPKRQFKFYIDWFYSADLGLHDVLSGSLSAYVRLKALFFSKTFNKPFLVFDDPFNLNMDVNLMQGGGRLGGIDLPVPGVGANSLGVFEMQLPFVDLQPLPQRPGATTTPYVPDAAKPLGFNGYCNVKGPA